MAKDIILRAENVRFSYDDEQTEKGALNGLNLEIERGKKYAIMGANGSGKSTFFFHCNGLNQPTSGTMYFEGKPFDYSRKGLLELRSKVGIIFQNPDDQLFSASVFQEISFGAMNLGRPEEEIRKDVEAVIEKIGITPFRDKPTYALSGGQKKQVSIADILVMHPELIILDEPAAALDPYHTTLVNEIVNQMTAEGITVLMATHDVNYAFSWADRVIVFKDGKVLKEGEPREVFEDKPVLEQTNLEQPAALQLFDSLVARGILSEDLQVPSTLKQLEDYIAQIK